MLSVVMYTLGTSDNTIHVSFLHAYLASITPEQIVFDVNILMNAALIMYQMIRFQMIGPHKYPFPRVILLCSRLTLGRLFWDIRRPKSAIIQVELSRIETAAGILFCRDTVKKFQCDHDNWQVYNGLCVDMSILVYAPLGAWGQEPKSWFFTGDSYSP